MDKKKTLYYTLNHSEVVSSTDLLNWGGSQLEITVTIGITDNSSNMNDNLIVTTKHSNSSGLLIVILIAMFFIIGVVAMVNRQKTIKI